MRVSFNGDGGNTWYIEAAAGSTTGTDHIRSGKFLIGKGNQDAYRLGGLQDKCLVGVICDGCGSGPHSEVGSNIATGLIVDSVLRNYDRFGITDQLLRCVEMDVLSRIADLASHFPGSFSQNVNDYFLFTTVLAIADRHGVYIDMIGDGCHLHPSMQTLYTESFPNNEPPYLAYNLVKSSIDPALLHFAEPSLEFLATPNSAGVTGSYARWTEFPFLIGSDGVENLEKMGEPLEQFYEDKYFGNELAISRRLLSLNSEVVKVEDGRIARTTGKLTDDTTLIAFRRHY